MNNLYEVLEICLQEIEQGADIDTVLFRYPDLAEELRPILEASWNASSMVVPGPSVEVVQRNRAKILQRAAQLREARDRSSKRIWFASFRRVVVTLAVIILLFVSGTNLVRAASTTLPGDNLYPVKRTWEDVLVLLAFNSQQREALEVEHENERHQELRELFAEGRSENVEFAGRVTSQNGNEWIVSPGITVIVSAQTQLHGPVGVGDAVRVEGETQGAMRVLAEEIKVLPPDAKLPNVGEVGEEHESEDKEHEESQQQIEIDSNKSTEGEAPKSDGIATSESEHKNESQNDGSDEGVDSAADDHSDDNHEEDSQKNEDHSDENQEDASSDD